MRENEAEENEDEDEANGKDKKKGFKQVVEEEEGENRPQFKSSSR